jgi:nitronate monooxygenase
MARSLLKGPIFVQFEDVRELVAGARGRKVFETGDLEFGIWTAGMVQGIIHDVPTVAELISRIVGDARALIAGRLAAALPK